MDRDLRFDLRLQRQHLEKKVIRPEDLEEFLRSLPDTSGNLADPGALFGTANPTVEDPVSKTRKDGRKR